MIRAFTLAVAQLGDPPIVRVFLKTMLLTLALLAALAAALWYGAYGAVLDYAGDETWANLAGLAAVAVAILSAWLLFRAVAVAVITIFGDEVVIAVEAKHYPQALATARKLSFWRANWLGLKSAGRALLVNLVLLPVYLLLLVTGVGTFVAFLLVNGWLLGRDLAELVAARHTTREGMHAWLKGSQGTRLALGTIIAGLMTVPFVNLAAPVLGAAMATHLFHGRPRS